MGRRRKKTTKRAHGNHDVAEVIIDKIRQSLTKDSTEATVDPVLIGIGSATANGIDNIAKADGSPPTSDFKYPCLSTISKSSQKGKKRVSAQKFDGLSEVELSKRHLPDILAENLDILMVGLNPSLVSVFKGHHFSGPGHHFWKCIHTTGIIPHAMTASEDYRLPQYGIGFTNLVERPTKSAAEVSKDEIESSKKALHQKIQYCNPKIIVLVGKIVFEAFFKTDHFDYGKQPEFFPNTNSFTFVIPPSTGCGSSYWPRVQDKMPFFVAIRKLRDFCNGTLMALTTEEIVFPISIAAGAINRRMIDSKRSNKTVVPVPATTDNKTRLSTTGLCSEAQEGVKVLDQQSGNTLIGFAAGSMTHGSLSIDHLVDSDLANVSCVPYTSASSLGSAVTDRSTACSSPNDHMGASPFANPHIYMSDKMMQHWQQGHLLSSNQACHVNGVDCVSFNHHYVDKQPVKTKRHDSNNCKAYSASNKKSRMGTGDEGVDVNTSRSIPFAQVYNPLSSGYANDRVHQSPIDFNSASGSICVSSRSHNNIPSHSVSNNDLYMAHCSTNGNACVPANFNMYSGSQFAEDCLAVAATDMQAANYGDRGNSIHMFVADGSPAAIIGSYQNRYQSTGTPPYVQQYLDPTISTVSPYVATRDEQWSNSDDNLAATTSTTSNSLHHSAANTNNTVMFEWYRPDTISSRSSALQVEPGMPPKLFFLGDDYSATRPRPAIRKLVPVEEL